MNAVAPVLTGYRCCDDCHIFMPQEEGPLCPRCLALRRERRLHRRWRAACLAFLALWFALALVGLLAPPLPCRLEPPTRLLTPIRPGVRGAPWAADA